ncbi:PTS sugar transporter subunit IIA [Vaginisenegalia massiliensis]|uniref:PTS sugar transporter subunit IIA n=1 Tax=Vaginisenegalia massiliensis TaxID=2058294 RepID=UPI000F54B035|nr:PTS sugar transporter subunit IIA [Vaginisenegalia massiliensis]
MIGIVIATHGKMSDGMKDAVNTIVGLSDQIVTCNLVNGQSVESLGQDIKVAIESVDEGQGVIVFTDLVSASPYNQTIMAISRLPETKKAEVYILGGVNLPMVLEAVNHRLLNTDISIAVQSIMQQGATSMGTWNVSQLEESTDVEDDDF